MQKLISIIIVNYNGRKWLKKCLDSIYVQSYKNYEVIIVDNASVDDSIKFLKANYPKVRIIKSVINRGFAGGSNMGYRAAKGEYILLLNNDTYLEKEYLKKFIDAFNKIPNLASVQSKIVLMDNPKKLDVVGAYWTNSTFLYYYGYGKDANLIKYNTPMPFFSNKGASMLIKKKVADEIGLFDEDFWCYYEETDFCHRAWLAGYECWYWPNAIMYHALGGTSTKFDNSYIQYHNFKNKLLTFLKNFEIRSLIFIIPMYITINLLLSFYWLIQGKYKHFFSLHRAIWWNVKNIKNTILKRRISQSFRKKSDKEILNKISKSPSLNYYENLLSGHLEKYIDR